MMKRQGMESGEVRQELVEQPTAEGGSQQQSPRMVSHRQMVAGTARSVTHMWVAKPTWPFMSGVITRVYPGVREKQWLNTSMVCLGGSVGDVFGLPLAGPASVVVAGSVKIR